MLKKDIALYKNGDRAAEMRLISFVLECEKKLDRAGLAQLEGVGGKVAAAARIAAEKVEVHLRSKGNQDQLKKRIKQCLDMAEAAGIFRSFWYLCYLEAFAERGSGLAMGHAPRPRSI